MSVEIRHQVDAGLGSVSAVVTSLPAGYNLGEKRVESGIKYVLAYNAGNSQISQGRVAAPIFSAGPYSLTVSTTSQGNCHVGALVAVNATVATAGYFWGACHGRVGGLVGDNVSAATGGALCIGVNGAVELMPQSVVTGKEVIGFNLGGAASKTLTTGALSGDCVVFFKEI